MDIQYLLDISSRDHAHLCPRQILGVRIGLKGTCSLQLEPNLRSKRILTIAETDGCFVDGLSAATNCTVGHRTLRIEDYGKVAATFIDTKTGRAFRIAPVLDVRERAYQYAPGESRRYFAQMRAYQIMPDDEMLSIIEIELNASIQSIMSRPGVRVNCETCGEEIMNEREVIQNGILLCHSCAGRSYYRIPISIPLLKKQKQSSTST